MKKNIAVVCGGYSKESVISLRSAEQIASVISPDYNAYTVYITRESWNAKIGDNLYPIDRNDFTFSLDGKKIVFDAVFMAIHGTPGEDGMLQSYFDMLNIPYTTCSAFVSALTFNKFACKVFLKEYGILTADAVLLRRNQPYSLDEISKRCGYPMFVKPNNGGSSFGVTKVKQPSDLQPAIDKAFAEDSEIIIEPFIKGTARLSLSLLSKAASSLAACSRPIMSRLYSLQLRLSAKMSSSMLKPNTPLECRKRLLLPVFRKLI